MSVSEAGIPLTDEGAACSIAPGLGIFLSDGHGVGAGPFAVGGLVGIDFLDDHGRGWGVGCGLVFWLGEMRFAGRELGRLFLDREDVEPASSAARRYLLDSRENVEDSTTLGLCCEL